MGFVSYYVFRRNLCSFRLHIGSLASAHVNKLYSSCVWVRLHFATLKILGTLYIKSEMWMGFVSYYVFRRNLCSFRLHIGSLASAYVNKLYSSCVWVRLHFATLKILCTLYIKSEMWVEFVSYYVFRRNLCSFRLHIGSLASAYVNKLYSSCAWVRLHFVYNFNS